MKNKLIIMSLLIVAIVVASFGFSHKHQGVNITNQNIDVVSTKVKKSIPKPELLYMVKGKYSRTVAESKLYEANLISDFIEGYPNNWITAYISVDISVLSKGYEVSLGSVNNMLTTEQKNMLLNAGIDSEILINVKYNTKNVVTNLLEESEMNVSLTVVPEIGAEFVGGYKSMINYLKENSNAEIAEIKGDKNMFSSIGFTINETKRQSRT